MAIDPVIAYHSVGFHRFELSCIRTRSIRDQIVRAELLVERLIARKLLVPGKRPLLVLGGGAAGVSAAVAACKSGIDTTLVEREPAPMTRQYGIKSRRLDPFEYDWPHGHWRQAHTTAPNPFALAYPPSTAEWLAVTWSTLLNSIATGAAKFPGVLDMFFGIDATIPAQLTLRSRPHKDMLVAFSPEPRWGASRRFGAAISCVGFSGEKTEIDSSTGGRIVGPAYWSQDSLEDSDLGLGPPKAGSPHKVLVSGAGDGAQQDFVRVLTGTFGLALADALELPTDPSGLTGLAQAVLAEDAALRALSMAEPKRKLPVAFQQWHDAYQRVADAIWDDWTNRGRIRKFANKVLKPQVAVTWVWGGPCLDYSFALNRVLALLVARLHAETARRHLSAAGDEILAGSYADAVIVREARATSVTPVGAPHRCDAHCNGRPHTVELELDGSKKVLQLGPFDYFVIRHGVNQKPLFGSPPVHEQRVPYFRPA